MSEHNPDDTILSKTTSGGQQVEVALLGDRFQVTFDGRVMGDGSLRRLNAAKAGVPPITHYIEAGGKAFGFTAAEAAQMEGYVRETRDAKEADLFRNVPGIQELRAARDAYLDDAERYHRQFERMMEDEDNDGARPPKSENPALKTRYQELAERFPRAALYLRAEAQDHVAHWADNSGKGAAGKRAMQILMVGGSIEEAEKALAARRPLND